MIRATLFYADGGMREIELTALTPYVIVPKLEREVGHSDDFRFIDVQAILSRAPRRLKPIPRRRFKLDRYEPSDESAVYIEEPEQTETSQGCAVEAKHS